MSAGGNAGGADAQGRRPAPARLPRLLDRVSRLLARVGAVLFFAIGAMITYDVVGRYVFNSPTVWAEELTRIFQIWATYLALAWVYRQRQLISITVLVDRLHGTARRVADAFSAAIISVFSAVVVWYGTSIVIESIDRGRATASMLRVPEWIIEISIPLCFLLLLLQALVDLVRALAGAEPVEPAGGDGATP